eukprot:6284281-Prymnesium_polylepis.1
MSRASERVTSQRAKVSHPSLQVENYRAPRTWLEGRGGSKLPGRGRPKKRTRTSGTVDCQGRARPRKRTRTSGA